MKATGERLRAIMRREYTLDEIARRQRAVNRKQRSGTLMTAQLIEDGQTLTAAKSRFGSEIHIYDDGFGPLWISRNSIGINGIVRARSWEDAYSICEDEFFPEASETLDEIVKEYGFKREHVKIVADPAVTVATDHCSAGERIARYPGDYPDGRLKPLFIRWETIETPDPDAWPENELFCEAFGFRPNGPNTRDTLNHGIYAKDLNGDCLEPLTPELLAELEITLEITTDEQA
jgi:hypothetical protein